jgi:hypothetical protein
MPNKFRKLPPEIREKIFEPLCKDWNGTMPAIIKALRSDKELYHEAMAIFYKEKEYVLHDKNDWTFLDMFKTAILSIKRIRIIVQ